MVWQPNSPSSNWNFDGRKNILAQEHPVFERRGGAGGGQRDGVSCGLEIHRNKKLKAKLRPGFGWWRRAGKVFQRLQKTKAASRSASHQAGGTSSNSCFFQLSAKYWQLFSTASRPSPPTKITTRRTRPLSPQRWQAGAGEARERFFGGRGEGIVILRYNMVRAEGGSGEAQAEAVRWEQRSALQESSSEGQAEELSADDPKMSELQLSLSRLREFAEELPGQRACSVPATVEEYCDKMEQYRVGDSDYVLQIAQRRVSKMLRNRKIKRNWNSEDITLLVWLVCKRVEQQGLAHHSQLESKDWQLIASLVAGSTPQKCKFRWLGLKKVKLVAHKWSKLESKLLTEAVALDEKTNWKAVSERLYEGNPNKNKVFRTAKQCRQHWNCFLNPAIQKGPWTLQEDRRLLEYVLQLEGSKKWSQIAKFMEGRTENALKNRFNLLIGRQRKNSGHLTEKRLVKTCLNNLILEQGQQDRPQPHSPLSPPLREPVLSTGDLENKETMVALPSASIYSHCHSSFRAVEGVMGYLGGFGGMVPQQIGQNTVYIGFLYPAPFIGQ